MSDAYECAIIGAGPGGLTAAIYAKRFRRSTIVFSDGVSRAEWIPKAHNVIGYERGISGVELLRHLMKQVEDLQIPVVAAQARVRQLDDCMFMIQTDLGVFYARKVILATGIEDLQPPLSNMRELRNHGVLRYCPICDAYDYRQKKMSVLIRDQKGFRAALFLRRFSPHLTVIAPESFKLSQEQSEILSSLVIDWRQGEVEQIELSASSGGVWTHVADGRPIHSDVVYVELGVHVRDEAIQGLAGVDRDEDGYFKTDDRQRLTLPGLYAVGDCAGVLGQISVAAGHAAIAATTAHNDLLRDNL